MKSLLLIIVVLCIIGGVMYYYSTKKLSVEKYSAANSIGVTTATSQFLQSDADGKNLSVIDFKRQSVPNLKASNVEATALTSDTAEAKLLIKSPVIKTDTLQIENIVADKTLSKTDLTRLKVLLNTLTNENITALSVVQKKELDLIDAMNNTDANLAVYVKSNANTCLQEFGNVGSRPQQLSCVSGSGWQKWRFIKS